MDLLLLEDLVLRQLLLDLLAPAIPVGLLLLPDLVGLSLHLLHQHHRLHPTLEVLVDLLRLEDLALRQLLLDLLDLVIPVDLLLLPDLVDL